MPADSQCECGVVATINNSRAKEDTKDGTGCDHITNEAHERNGY